MKIYFVLIIITLLSSCVYDYELADSAINEKDYLVINSILNSDRTIVVYFYKTQKTDTGYVCETIQNLHVILKEDDTILFEGIVDDTVLRISTYPKTGSLYSIRVKDGGTEELSASTRIPEVIDCNVSMSFGASAYNWRDCLTFLKDFPISFENKVSLWITAYKVFENNELVQYNELYANNLLIDVLNRSEGMDVLNPVVGSLYYDGFLRVKNSNLSRLGELIFTPTHAYYYGSSEPDSEQVGIRIKLITASPEYDQYCTTLFKQKAMIIYDDDLSAIVYQPTQVYSNIKNGLGIFAGMSETNYYYTLPSLE